jgi:hypothetical protein
MVPCSLGGRRGTPSCEGFAEFTDRRRNDAVPVEAENLLLLGGDLSRRDEACARKISVLSDYDACKRGKTVCWHHTLWAQADLCVPKT